MLRLSRRSLRPSVLPCCCAEDEDIAPAGHQHENARGPRAVRKQPPPWLRMHTDRRAATEPARDPMPQRKSVAKEGSDPAPDATSLQSSVDHAWAVLMLVACQHQR